MKFRFRSHSAKSLWFACALVLVPLVFALSARAAWARGGGFASGSCGGCHRGGTEPTLKIESATTTINPGQTVRITVTAEVGQARNLGFYLSASSGRLMPVSGESTKVAGDEGITHSSPIGASGGRVSVRADWTAPAAPGGVDFRLAAVAGNGDGRSGGDGTNVSFLSVPFGCSGGGTYYRDFDGDGFGADMDDYTRSCGKPEGYGEKVGDCDDNEPKINITATEICNRRDDDCDGLTDEGLEGVVLYPDEDGDGWGYRGAGTMMMMGCGTARGWGIEGTDCDDKNKDIFPGAKELCNLKDDDCNGRIDEGARAECGLGWCRRLAAGCDGIACVPGRPKKETCNLLDDDCDGEVDEDPASLCEEESTCFEGRCTPTDEVPDEVTGGASGTADAGTSPGAGGEDAPSDASSGCSYVPSGNASGALVAMLGALGLALARFRRRR